MTYYSNITLNALYTLAACIFPLLSRSQGTWVQKNNLTGLPRQCAVAFSIGSKGYIGTGNSYPYTNDFWEWDQASDTWTQRTNFQGTARDEAVGFSIGTKGYIGTGIDGVGRDDFWEWDQATDTWTQRMNFPGTPRGDAVGFSIGTKGYILTGQNIFSTYTQDVWEWDQTTGLWTAQTSFTTSGRAGAVGFSIGNKGYFGTGIDNGNNFLKDFWEFDPASSTWTQKADFEGTPRYFATGFGIDGCKPKGYIGTGLDTLGPNGFTNDFWEWDQATNDWDIMADFAGSKRFKAVAFSIGGKGYIGTGEDANGINNDLWEFTPDSVSLKPNSLFASSNNCKGGQVAFSDSSSVPSPNFIQSWNWDFGDGSAEDTVQNPHHIYFNAGSYTATLIVSNNFGCKDTLTKIIDIFHTPLANFTQNNVCLGAPMTFNNVSSINNADTISGYVWMFGDAGPANTQQNPAYTYVNADTFNVTLIASSLHACADTVTIPIIVYDLPTAGFTATNCCLYDSVQLTNNSTNPVMGSITNWIWNFDDGTLPNITELSPDHLYSVPGNYQVSLIVRSIYGCTDTLVSPLTVYPIPVANFSNTNVCLNQTTTFNDLSVTSSGTISFWDWNFGDNSATSITQNPAHAYTTAGSYSVSLVATSNYGCRDTIEKTATIHPLPQAAFTALNVCDGSFAQFNDLSDIPNPGIIQGWSWNFGDGTVVNNQNTAHLFSSPGSYTVQLTTTSNFGCIDSVSKPFIVNPKPQILFSASDTAGCEPLCITFQNASSIINGSISNWQWDFGDGGTANIAQDVQHCYINENTDLPVVFSPSLTAVSDSGCTTVSTKPNYITVYPAPVAEFTASPGVASLTSPTIDINNTSIGGNTWEWSFGDTQSSVIMQPLTHTYPDTGSYIITLISISQYNCRDTATQTIIVEPEFIFYIPNAFTPNGDGINDAFTGKGVFIKEFEMLIFDRWGNLIYKTEDIDKPWNGIAHGGEEIAQRDVYVYAVKVMDFKMIERTYRGTVTLVR